MTFAFKPDSMANVANKYPSPALFPDPQNTMMDSGFLFFRISNENLAALRINSNPYSGPLSLIASLSIFATVLELNTYFSASLMLLIILVLNENNPS